jgi:pimeloyl-ACP methyl ester carboxylesterase
LTTSKEETINIAGAKLVVVRGGAGKPLFVCHDEMGYTGWMKWNEALAESRELIIPLQPGFGKSPRQDWMWRHRDLANYYLNVIREMGLDKPDVVGFSAGGYIAAEMAAACPELLGSLTLVGPMGIKPDVGEIGEMFACTVNSYLRMSVHDKEAEEYGQIYGGEMSAGQFELFEDARAESARIGWEPYMFNPSLPQLLRSAVNTQLPTLLIRGEHDAIIPPNCIEKYKEALPQAEVVSISNAGHRAEIENSGEFISAVQKFLS